MRYDEMRAHVREHFSQILRQFRERSAADGPASTVELDALRASETLADGDLSGWLSLTRYGDDKALVRAFCERRGIEDVPEGEAAARLARELQKGYREYAARALEYSAQFDTLPLSEADTSAPAHNVPPVQSSSAAADALGFAEVQARYFEEMKRNTALAPKTEADKEDALALLAELTGGKPPALITKTDAREVKAAIFKLPKNRSKNPRTRGLPLSKMLELSDVERLSTTSMNRYIGHMQTFFAWAVNNGYATENVFMGLKIRKKATLKDEGRKAFTAEQLRLMFAHLTEADSTLVKKDTHKWPALIGIFTGMRLNEIAQLEVGDIALHDGTWCFDVTPDGSDQKRLKNSSSRRRVPLHDRLIGCGFLDFHRAQQDGGQVRLFPDLTYSPQNGFGRNAGRWFNERFIKEIGLSGQDLSFHCLRHTMQTRLAHADVPQPRISALLGHAQTGVSLNTYFRAGYLTSQLHEAINRFDF
jgi:integrase